jgi:DNA primase
MRARAVGLEVTGTSGGEELVVCPFHDDHNASATWNPKSDLFYCFTCGEGMNLEQLLRRTGRPGL